MTENTKLWGFEEQIHKTLETFNLQIVQMQLQFQQPAASYVAAIDEQFQSIWSGLNEKVKEAFELTGQALEKAELLGTLGWTLPMNATPGEIVCLIFSIKDIPSADKAFTNYYMEHNATRLKCLETDLLTSNELQQWRPVLEEAILDLDDSRYRSCIALLLPLIEGVSAINFSTPQFHKKTDREKFFLDKLQAERQGSLTEHIWIWRSFKGFAEVFFKFIDFKDPSCKPSLLNRPWILHGRGIPDPNLSDCLRLLQALDTISLLSKSR